MITYKQAFSNKRFVYSFLTGFILTITVIASFPSFFSMIEVREGLRLHDMVLHHLPAIDCSIAIFICIWSTVLLFICQVVKHPVLLLQLLWAYLFLCLARIITIYCIPLEPPANLIPLSDPLANQAYGSQYITKDLFFSGHTSTQFLFYLCFASNTWQKKWALVSSILVGCLVLVQHVHYTIDVVFAFPFTYLVYKAMKYWLLKQNIQQQLPK